MIFIGNGDIKNMLEATRLAQEFDLDGVMVGRGIFENPLLFRDFDWSRLSKKQTIILKLNLLLIHLRIWEKDWLNESGIDTNPKKSIYFKDYAMLKKFFKVYISGFYNSGDLRQKLMNTKNIPEAREIIMSFYKNLESQTDFGLEFIENNPFGGE